jgi:dUTP pyrophosphatase
MSCNCNKKKDIKIKRLTKDAILPEYKSEMASGMDLAIPMNIMLDPGEKVIIKLGWACALPPGTEMQIRPRSGTSAKTDLHLSNSPGTIDEDYRGEVGIIAENKSRKNSIVLIAGDRIAQGVVCPVYRCNTVEVEELDDTARGEGGFGSTGQ